MRSVLPISLLTASLLVGSTLVTQAAAPPRAKLSPAQASAIAARKVHGHAKSAKYEFEDGRWQYAVIVVSGKQMYELEVDPNTGKVLDSEKTSAAEEGREAAADKAAAHKTASSKTVHHAHHVGGSFSVK